MGYIKRHAIVVTGYDNSKMKEAREKALSLEMSVTEILGPVINGDLTFFIGPDGSKEGWEDSDIGDRQRDLFIEYLKADKHFEYAEFYYGEDNGNSRITRHN